MNAKHAFKPSVSESTLENRVVLSMAYPPRMYAVDPADTGTADPSYFDQAASADATPPRYNAVDPADATPSDT